MSDAQAQRAHARRRVLEAKAHLTRTMARQAKLDWTYWEMRRAEYAERLAELEVPR